jgi:hypothetical protein
MLVLGPRLGSLLHLLGLHLILHLILLPDLYLQIYLYLLLHLYPSQVLN